MNKSLYLSFETIRDDVDFLSFQSLGEFPHITFRDRLKQEHHRLRPLEHAAHNSSINFSCPVWTPDLFLVILQPPGIPEIEYIRNPCDHRCPIGGHTSREWPDSGPNDIRFAPVADFLYLCYRRPYPGHRNIRTVHPRLCYSDRFTKL